MRTDEKLEAFAARIAEEQARRYAKEYPALQPPEVAIRPGRKFFKVDVGESGKYMVDENGTIYGIKGYGVVHRGHRYGTLDTIDAWDWSGYVAVPKSAEVAS